MSGRGMASPGDSYSIDDSAAVTLFKSNAAGGTDGAPCHGFKVDNSDSAQDVWVQVRDVAGNGLHGKSGSASGYARVKAGQPAEEFVSPSGNIHEVTAICATGESATIYAWVSIE